jgi:glyoxylase-like metal-dependent hydrolase (beta-lactamase superfamily II)
MRLSLAFALPGLAAPLAAQAPDAPFTLHQLAPGVYAAIDRDGRAGANAGFVIGDDGVVMVDSFQFPEAAETLLREIRKLTPLPVRYVISTHYHIDHVGGNGVLRNAGARVIAHRNVAAWINTENLKFFGPDQPKEQALVKSLPSPDILLEQGAIIRLGTRRIEVQAVPGHTGGDLVVFVPDARVVFAGDLFWRRVAPSLIDATVSKWTGSLVDLLQRPDAAVQTYVPGQGGVARLPDIADFRQYLEDLTAAVKTGMGAGLAGDGLVAAALPQMKQKYGTWTLFDRLAPQQIRFLAEELSGSKRVPQS